MAAITSYRTSLIIAFLGYSLIVAGQPPAISQVKIYFEQRDFEKAKPILASIGSEHPDYADAFYYQGRIAVEEKRYELSIEKFQKAIDINPLTVEYHNWLGVMYGVVAMNSGKLKQAYLAPKIKNEFEKAAAIDPDNVPTQWGLLTYYIKAPFFLGGSGDKALACAEVISRHDKAQGIRAYALVHAGQGKIGLAETEYLQAIKMQPTQCEHVFALAEFYNEQKKFSKSIALYEDVLLKNPQNMVASFHLGKVSAHSGLQTEKGIKCLMDYLRYTPRPNEPAHCDANLGLAMIYEKKGDQVAAKKYYRSSLEQYPGLKEAQEGLGRVD
ncbi:hypothetical protein BH09BAC3_BH09BAC3_08340 [soil metagenome]